MQLAYSSQVKSGMILVSNDLFVLRRHSILFQIIRRKNNDPSEKIGLLIQNTTTHVFPYRIFAKRIELFLHIETTRFEIPVYFYSLWK